MAVDTVEFDSADDIALADKMNAGRQQIVTELKKLIVGQDDVVDLVLLTLFVGGNSLIVGVPGLAKTLLIATLAKVRRPEVQPHPVHARPDAVGHHRHRPHSGGSGDRPPPDGVRARPDLRQHRAGRRNQPHAAQDAVGAARSDAGAPRHDPGADLQARRAVLRLRDPEPDRARGHLSRCPKPSSIASCSTSSSIIRRKTRSSTSCGRRRRSSIRISSGPVTGPDLVAFQRLVRRVPVAEPVMRYALHLVRTSRPKSKQAPELSKKYVAFGASVRAAQNLVLGGKARALTSGRYHVSFDDIRAMAHPVLRHRVLTNFRAESEGITTDQIIDQLLEMVPVPKSGM